MAGYSPERLYSNMPSGQQSQAGGGGASRGGHFSVVESGMYKVGEADRGLAAVGSQQYRPEPIYWKQVRIFFLIYHSTSDTRVRGFKGHLIRFAPK